MLHFSASAFLVVAMALRHTEVAKPLAKWPELALDVQPIPGAPRQSGIFGFVHVAIDPAEDAGAA
jgi:hypothetical protein